MCWVKIGDQKRIVVRGDSGFARDVIMNWCEGQLDVFYLLGKARNARLQTMIEKATVNARMRSCLTGVSCREYVDTTYRTLTSWSRERRMLAKAEVLVGDKSNPRFVVTNIPREGIRSRRDLSNPTTTLTVHPTSRTGKVASCLREIESPPKLRGHQLFGTEKPLRMRIVVTKRSERSAGKRKIAQMIRLNTSGGLCGLENLIRLNVADDKGTR